MSLITKYNDLKNLDKLSLTEGKVSNLKIEVGENIEELISLHENNDSITIDKCEIPGNITISEIQTTEVSTKLFWKRFSTYLVIALIVITAFILLFFLRIA